MANRKANNAIVSVISSNQFAYVRYCITAKQAWDKLRILHKDDKQVKDLKLQMTLSKFEDLRMLEFETFSVFFEKVEMLTNEALGLGKPIYVTIVVQKILRCLPKRFQAKKAVIQEFQDLNCNISYRPRE
ncbi:uncharacterized protein [Malus domestica]|uniref:uncharacterized protein n=1 Tax=Malus domestica TaxID=3750 RepID=UPI00397510CD